MKKIFSFIGLFPLLLVLQLTSEVQADGVFFSNRNEHLFEPEQKAIIVWDGRTETMLLSAKVRSEDTSDLSHLSHLVWLIPLESSEKPKVHACNISVFKTFVDYFAPEIPYGASGAAAGVSVLEMKEIDIYDIAILKVSDAEELISWLNTNDYAFPESAVTVVRNYLKTGASYFVANKIDLGNRPEAKKEELKRDLTRGLATPLRIDFKPAKPVYPLRISSIHEGLAKIEVYFCSDYVAQDVTLTLRFDEEKVLPHRIMKQVAPHLDLKKPTHVTRLVYEGNLSNLSADAIFQPSPYKSTNIDRMSSSEERAFEDIFLKASVKDAQYIQNEDFMERLRKYVESYPATRFTDDAVFLLVMYVQKYGNEQSHLIIPAERLEEYLKIIENRKMELEEFTEGEIESLLKSMSRFYAEKGILKEFLMLQVAEYFKRIEGNREGSGRLAKEIYSFYDHFPELDAQRVQLLLPEHQIFEDYFDQAVSAFAAQSWEKASQLLEKAIASEETYQPCNIAPDCSKNPPAAYYLLGISRSQLGHWPEARSAFQKMVEIAPEYYDSMLPLEVSSDEARSLIVATYLEEGDAEKGLEEGMKLLSLLQNKPRMQRTEKMIAGEHYNLACAYSLKKNTSESLKHMKEALFRDPDFGKHIEMDEHLNFLRNTEDFKKLPRQIEEEKQKIASTKEITTVEPLIKALKDVSPRVRYIAAQALGRIKDPRAINPLIEALKDRNQEVRLNAALALCKTNDPRVVEHFISLISDQNHSVRLRAVEYLGKIKAHQAIEPLAGALKDESWQVRRSAAEALGRIRDSRSIEPLTTVLNDRNSAVKSVSVQSLEKIGDIHVAKLLIEKLKDRDRELKFDAAVALRRIPKDEKSIVTLKEILKDPSLIGILIEALEDEDETVRSTAVWALGISGDKRAVEPLIKTLKNKRKYLREKAADALATIASQHTDEPLYREAFIAAIKDKNRTVRFHAVCGLENMKKNDRSVEALKEAIMDVDSEVQERAKRALKKWGYEDSASLVDNSLPIKREANESLKLTESNQPKHVTKVEQNADELYIKGYNYDKQKDYRKAAVLYLKAAEKGHAKAQNSLGFMYSMGQGVGKDYNEATRWFQKAAGQGDAQAQFNLGVMYSKGQGVGKDLNEAIKWYRSAAEQKYAPAQNILGLMYSRGQGVKQDYEEAVKWYRMAAEQGYAKAQKNLSKMYLTGRGVEKDKEKADMQHLNAVKVAYDKVEITSKDGLIAHYLFDSNAFDSSGVSGEISLLNTSFVDNTLYLNGYYERNTGENGYQAIAQLTNFNLQTFAISLDFYPLDFNTVGQYGTRRENILTGGRTYRWFGLRHYKGKLQLTLNNRRFTHTFENSSIEKEAWHRVICSFDLKNEKIKTVLDGKRLEDIKLPSSFNLNIIKDGKEVTGKRFTFTNYSNGNVFYGYVDNFKVYNRSLYDNEI